MRANLPSTSSEQKAILDSHLNQFHVEPSADFFRVESWFKSPLGLQNPRGTIFGRIASRRLSPDFPLPLK